MRKMILTGVACAVALGLFGGTLSAAPFEPLFQLQGLDGKVMVQAPGSGNMVKAEENRAYPYGTRVQTDKRGSVVILLSEGNTVTLAASTTVKLDENATDKTRKILVVDSGSVDIKLDTEFHQSNGFDVITPVAVCKAIGCEFNVATRSEPEIDVTSFAMTEGTVAASGPDFKVPAMDADDELTVTTAKDGSFSRLEIEKGEVDIEIRNTDGTPKVKTMSEGGLLKMWRRTSEAGGKRIVTILVTTPDGTLEEAITYTEDIVAVAAATTGAAAAALKATDAPEAKPESKAKPQDEEEPVTAEAAPPKGDMPPADETAMQRLPAVGSPATLGVEITPIRAAAAAGLIAVIPPRRGGRPDPTKTGLR